MTGRLSHVWVVLLAAVTGCVTLAKPAPPVHRYRLDYQPPAVDRPALPVTLHVAPFRTAQAYSSLAIVYREDAYHLGTYTYHRWVSDPGSLASELLARDLAESARYAAVSSGPSLLVADYELSGEVEEIEQRFDEGCRAHLRMRVLLRRSRARDANDILFQRRYEDDEPCATDSAAAAVAALSDAMQVVSAAMQTDVHEAIAADLRREP